MNRKSAESLLDAYAAIIRSEGKTSIAGVEDSLREVIVDAMCSTAYIPWYVQPNAPSYPTYPKITWTGGTE